MRKRIVRPMMTRIKVVKATGFAQDNPNARGSELMSSNAAKARSKALSIMIVDRTWNVPRPVD